VVDQKGVGPQSAVGGRGLVSRGLCLIWGTGGLFDPLGLGGPGELDEVEGRGELV
jgi:hypothetical protein